MPHQTPVLSLVSLVTFVSTLLVEADLVECGVKVAISMVASYSTDCIRLARVSQVDSLHGFHVIKNYAILPLSDLVTSLYFLNSFTRQTSAFSQTGSFIFPTWNLLLAVFDLPPFHMIRKLSLNVLKFSFHLDHTVLTTMKLIYAKHQTKILGILNLNILLPLLHPR